MAEIFEEGIRFNAWFAVRFQRTLRVPNDGRTYPLPAGLGTFPIHRASDFAARLPSEWGSRVAAFIPMYQREALWIAFRGAAFRPHAVKIAVGGINVLTGAPHDLTLRSDPQDYLVSPPQIWLDGVRTERGIVRQFVAMPLGSGATVEGALSGAEVRGGIQLVVFEPRPGRFPEQAPESAKVRRPQRLARGETMGMAAGGQIEQRIYPDPHGIDTWAGERALEVEVRVLNSSQFERVTGKRPPPTPIDARVYAEHGLPWFELYDEHLGDIGGSTRLSSVPTLPEGDTGGESVSEATSSDLPVRGITPAEGPRRVASPPDRNPTNQPRSKRS